MNLVSKLNVSITLLPLCMRCFWYCSRQLCIQRGKTILLLFLTVFSSSISCFLEVSFNQAFYADYLCLMTSCVIALQELLLSYMSQL